MDLKEELDSTVAMKLDKDNLAKILSLWLHVEALTPFDLDKNDLIEQMPGSLNQPRSSLFREFPAVSYSRRQEAR